MVQAVASARVVLRCLTADSGAQSATTTGTIVMPTLSADSWNSPEAQYMLIAMLTLAVGLDRSGWTTFSILEMRRVWKTATFEDGGYTTVATMRMLEWSVPLVISVNNYYMHLINCHYIITNILLIIIMLHIKVVFLFFFVCWINLLI